MKDQQARDSADIARARAEYAHQRITDLDRGATDAVRILAREQQRLVAEQRADDLVDGFVEAVKARREAEQNARIAKLEASVERLTEQLAVALPAEPYAPSQVTTEDDLDGAILREEVVEFVYRDREGVQSLRQVSPYDLTDAANGARLLVGYDHDRDGIRQFRIERIDSVIVLPPDEATYREPAP